jgi:hypothetical protein
MGLGFLERKARGKKKGTPFDDELETAPFCESGKINKNCLACAGLFWG